MNTTPNTLWLSTIEISILTQLSRHGLLEKAKRQKWPYSEKRYRGGNPLKLFELYTLPDDIQSTWANWTAEQYREAVSREMAKGERGRPDCIPPTVASEQAKEALAWPERRTYYRHPGDPSLRIGKRGKSAKIYDGVSRGLCPRARQILLKRFPELSGASAENRSKWSNFLPQGADLHGQPDGLYGQVQETPGQYQSRPRSSSDRTDRLEAEIEGFKRLIAEKDRFIALQERMLLDKERQIEEKDFQLQGKESRIKDQKDLIREKSEKIRKLKKELEFAQRECASDKAE